MGFLFVGMFRVFRGLREEKIRRAKNNVFQREMEGAKREKLLIFGIWLCYPPIGVCMYVLYLFFDIYDISLLCYIIISRKKKNYLQKESSSFL